MAKEKACFSINIFHIYIGNAKYIKKTPRINRFSGEVPGQTVRYQKQRSTCQCSLSIVSDLKQLETLYLKIQKSA